MSQAINTDNSVLTVKVVSAGVATSWCLKAGELLLGTLGGVHLDSADSVRRDTRDIASSHHDSVLKFNTTSSAEN